MGDKKEHFIKIETNRELGILVAKSKDILSTEEQELHIKIANSINSSLNNICNTWINDYLEAVYKNDNLTAYNIFEENKGLLLFSKNEEDLINLRKLNYNLLDEEKEKTI